MKSLYSLIVENKSDKPTKMDPNDKDNVIELGNKIDVGRMIDKYDIRWYTDYKNFPDSVFVNKEDWDKAKKSSKNSDYFDNLLKSAGKMLGHEN